MPTDTVLRALELSDFETVLCQEQAYQLDHMLCLESAMHIVDTCLHSRATCAKREAFSLWSQMVSIYAYIIIIYMYTIYVEENNRQQ